MTLNEMAAQAHANSQAKGFWDGPTIDSPAQIAAKLMLIVSELSEALECVRDGNNGLPLSQGWLDEANKGKPEGFPYEMADVVIRCGDLCRRVGVDLDAVVADKMKFNATRQHRHGKVI